LQNPPPPRDINFILDECLPHVISVALNNVGFPITSCREQEKSEWLDDQLIPWIGEQNWVWITKDDAARRGHRALIQKARISVIWIRGIERRDGTTTRNNILAKDVLHLLVAKLDDIKESVSNARGPRFFLLFMNAKAPTLKVYTTLDDIENQLANPRRNRK
jgi:hypothetical protein